MKNKVKPLRPSDVVNAKKYSIPDEVISAFNTLIAQNLYDGASTFTQVSVVDEIIKNLRQTSDLEIVKSIKDDAEGVLELKSLIHKLHWLDVEDLFREVGWTVSYDKPAYNECYEPTFTFMAKER